MKLNKDDILPLLELDGLNSISPDDMQIHCYWVSNESFIDQDLTWDNCSLKYIPLKGWNDEYKKFLQKSFRNVKAGIYSNVGEKDKGHLIFIDLEDEFIK